MSLSLVNATATSAFLYCPPVTDTPWTTVYETVLPAACETSQWMATYTVTEICLGDKANYVTPTMPPGFVTTTVHCHACEEPEVVITCPGAQPTGMGKPTVHIVATNGVTATVVASPAPVPVHGGIPAAPAAPTGFAVNWSASGSGSGSGSELDTGCGGHGCGYGSGSGSEIVSGSELDTGCGGKGCGGASGYASGSVTDNENESGCGGKGCGGASGYGSGITGGEHGSGCGGKGCGASNNGTWEHPHVVLTGAAASVHKSLMVGAGLAFLAGPFFLL